MDTRTIVVVVLLVLAFLAYEEYVVTPLTSHKSTATATASPHPGARSTPALASSGQRAVAATPEATAAPEVNVPAGAPVALKPATASTPRSVEIDTDYYDATFTTLGARLKSLTLDKFRETADPNSPPYQMVGHVPAGAPPFAMVVGRGGQLADDRALVYTTSAPPRITLMAGQSATVTFTAKTAKGMTLEKSFTFHDSSYMFTMAAKVSGAAALETLGMELSQPLIKKSGYENEPYLQYLVHDKTGNETVKKIKKGLAPVSGTIGYAGFGDLYFLMAYLPQAPREGTLEMGYAAKEAQALLLFPGSSGRMTAKVYIGPKLISVLQVADPLLSKAIDFGWSGFIAKPFLRALEVFHLFSSNWGVDILLLTLAIRLLMVPISIRGQRTSMRLQRLQPQIEKIREKFKDDSERLNREMMDVYKRNHVSPLGGCLPMLIQFPVFWGLFEALLNAVQLRHQPFIWWINDLSAPDCLKISWMPNIPYINCHGLPVLVILMGISTYFQTRLSPMSPDPTQQKTMAIMPLVFTVFFIYMPSGLTLYYFASNILGIIQQLFLNWEYKQSTVKAGASA